MDFKSIWNTAANQEKKQFGDLPEGIYKAKVMACRFDKTKAGDKDMVCWDLQVTEGDQKNNHIWVYRPFSKTEESEQNQKAVERATNDFKQLDLPADADVISQTMVNVIGKVVEIELKNGNNGQFKNFKRIIDGEAKPAEPIGDGPF